MFQLTIIQGFINIDFIKKCNKIKDFNASDEEIEIAIKNSQDLELDESSHKLRRKENKPLPSFEDTRKKVKLSSGENSHGVPSKTNEENGSEKHDENKLDFTDFEP